MSNRDTLDIEFNLPKDNDANLANLAKDIDKSSMMEQEKERFKQDTDQRKALVIWMMVVVSMWLIFTCCVVITELCLLKKISDTVFCMLLGTTTVNVLGLAMIVLKGLFPQSKNK